MSAFVRTVSARVLQVVDAPAGELSPISVETGLFLAPARRLLEGGKRSRARLAELGWRSAGGQTMAQPIVRIGSALELFQAAALVHDDVIDDAESRRGLPVAHRVYQRAHTARSGKGEGERFGLSAAILLGDVLLALAEREFASGLAAAGPGGAQAAQVWHQMVAEVAIGQFLDIEAATMELPGGQGDSPPPATDPHAQRAPERPAPPNSDAFEEALRRAMTVLRHKAAHYSVFHPLRLGASLAGAHSELLDSLGQIGEPLGEAFQLRDDILGVFGDPAVTGKPAGDDLAEGKRTPLVLLGLRAGSPTQRAQLRAALGRSALPAPELEAARTALIESGALDELESMIEERRLSAHRAIEDSPLPASLKEEFSQVCDTLTIRES